MTIKNTAPNKGAGSGGTAYVLPAATASTLGGIKVGTNLSINGSGVLSATGGSGGTDKTTTTPLVNGTAEIGDENKYADGKHVHPTDISRASQSQVDAMLIADNVAIIVATKAVLTAYPTAGINKNDMAVVVADEKQGGQKSYYLRTGPGNGNTWTYQFSEPLKANSQHTHSVAEIIDLNLGPSGNVQVGKIVSVTDILAIRTATFGTVPNRPWSGTMRLYVDDQFGSFDSSVLAAGTEESPAAVTLLTGSGGTISGSILGYCELIDSSTRVVVIFPSEMALGDGTSVSLWYMGTHYAGTRHDTHAHSEINFSPFDVDSLLMGNISSVDKCLSPAPVVGDTVTLTTHAGRTYAVIVKRADGSEPDPDLPPFSGVTTPVTVSGSGNWFGGNRSEGFPPQIYPGYRQVSLSLYSPLLRACA